MDPAELIREANCLNCYLTQAPLLALALLNRIADNIGGVTPPEDDGLLTDPDNEPIAIDPDGSIIVPD